MNQCDYISRNFTRSFRLRRKLSRFHFAQKFPSMLYIQKVSGIERGDTSLKFDLFLELLNIDRPDLVKEIVDYCKEVENLKEPRKWSDYKPRKERIPND